MEFNKKLFQQFDKNGDGNISAEELVTILNNFGHSFSVEEAQDMIKNVGNNDDVITFDEFFEISEDWDASFSIFDTDGNGVISAAELRQKLTEFGLFASDHQLEELVRSADADGNGKLDKNEWKDVLKHNRQPTTERKMSQLEGSAPRGVSDLWKTVNHIALVVSDVGRSVAFYSGVLGMKQILRPDFDRFGAWFTLGNIDLHLIHGRPAVHPDEDLIVGHIALNCGDDYDVRQLMSRLRNLGVPYRENISVPNPATKKQVVQAFVRDPDGYYLEFCSCESLEEFLQEKMTVQKGLWDFQRTKAMMIAKSKMIEWLNHDNKLAQQKYMQSLNRWGMARIIKQYGADTCKDVSESTIAVIARKFKTPESILSIIKEKENNPLFANILKNYNTDHLSLLIATNKGDLDAVQKGFQEGLEINYVDSSHRTCLHVASENGNLDIVTFLVKECMADTMIKDFRGLTPLECAENSKSQDVVEFLEKTANSNRFSDRGDLAHDEYQQIKQEVLDWRKKMRDPNIVDNDKLDNLITRQKTYGDILQNATKDELKFLLGMFNNNVPNVLSAIQEKIVAQGNQLFSPPAFYERNMKFYTPQAFSMKIKRVFETDVVNFAEVMHAAISGNLDILKSAHESGRDLNKADYDMKTALHRCCEGENMECVKFLVEECMVAVAPTDRWGLAPQDYARTAQNNEIVQYLAGKLGTHDIEKKI